MATKTATVVPHGGFSYNERPLTGMAKIINIVGRIKSYEGNVPYEYTFNEISNIRQRCEKDAQEVKELYMSLLECLKDIEINEILVQTLQLLQSYKAVGLMNEALRKITISVPYISENTIREFNLCNAIYNTLYYTGLQDLHVKAYEKQVIEQKNAEIERLERKGEQIIGFDSRTLYSRKTGERIPNVYYDWYQAHIFDKNSHTWRERSQYELENTGIYPVFHWANSRVRYHSIKAGQSFVICKGQKIKVVDVGEYTEMVKVAYEQPQTAQDQPIMYKDNLYYSSNTDYLYHSLLIVHIGEINNNQLQVVSVYELKEILEKAGVYGKYSSKFYC